MSSPSPKRSKGTAAPPLRLTVTAAAGRQHSTFIARRLRKAHALLKPPLRELSVALVGDQRMSELHQRFMNIAGPTDVLTFPLDEDQRGRVVGGEVVVCVPEARRRAREHDVALRDELLLYALHGMLHLCGHDDRTAGGYQKMHRTEDRILTALGIGPTFKRGPGTNPGRGASAKRSAKRSAKWSGKRSRA